MQIDSGFREEKPVVKAVPFLQEAHNLVAVALDRMPVLGVRWGVGSSADLDLQVERVEQIVELMAELPGQLACKRHVFEISIFMRLHGLNLDERIGLHPLMSNLCSNFTQLDAIIEATIFRMPQNRCSGRFCIPRSVTRC